MSPTPSPGQIAQVACILEATARKPGNVHRDRDFDDCTYLDFILSAAAIGPAMDTARARGVGPSVLEAVQSTRRVVSTNTNLGMILLLAPLCAASDPRSVREVLDALTVEDARSAYRAIRLAMPGGLGASADQDIRDEPTVTLLEAMTLAADRDLVARQYSTGYAEVFDVAVPALKRAIEAGRDVEQAVIESYLTTLSRIPDTLILRKRGPQVAAEASSRAAEALACGSTRALDEWLREDGHARNPGATADLIAASLYVALVEGILPLPLPQT